MRRIYLALGWFFVSVGIIGVFLPVLPTTPFILVAAACFARGSPAAERWLMEHPVFGPSLVDWRERGAIRRRAKVLAIVMMAISFAGLVIGGWMPLWAILTLGAIMLTVAAYIATRPEG